MRLMGAVVLTALLSGCASAASSGAAPTPTSRPSPAPTRPPPTPAPTATAVVGKPFASFLHVICSAFASGNAGTIINSLPHYEYNSGLRYGTLGGAEGQTADPSLMQTWLASARPRCVAFTPGVMGHGTVLTAGWKTPAPASLLDLDMYSGQWKINDFTFADRAALNQAIQTASPVLPYRR